jgi:hypothetical protein
MTEDDLKKVMLAIAAGLEAIEHRLTQIEENTRHMRDTVEREAHAAWRQRIQPRGNYDVR